LQATIALRLDVTSPSSTPPEKLAGRESSRRPPPSRRPRLSPDILDESAPLYAWIRPDQSVTTDSGHPTERRATRDASRGA
jgi:hypothetical protein